MPEVKPFAALKPHPDLASRICELPYDVVSSEEARALAGANPLSFFHVSKPEIDLAPGTDAYSPAVYERGRENFARLIAEGALRQDPHPHFYLYRQALGTHRQTGIVGVASCADYQAGLIKKHELTRVDKEDDRVRHIEALKAQTGPAFLVHRATTELDRLVAEGTAVPPPIDFTASDGIRHTAWIVQDKTATQSIESALARQPALYIADGHHRTAAAARVALAQPGCQGSSHFLAVIFPHDQLQILAYHRVLKDLNGHAPGDLLRRLEALFEPVPGPADQPGAKHEVSLYLAGCWRRLRFRPALTAVTDPIGRLDVALLQQHVLEPVLGITDPRTSERIGFVGGIRGAAELRRLVDSGESACAFALFPTGIEDLMTIADQGGIMPPKSTWFEPKLRDALFCHLLD
jgi:uncharacterized protein (DUF1015 family)